jgi:Protein of unknown function (DUF1214)
MPAPILTSTENLRSIKRYPGFVQGNADGTVAGLLVSYEGFQRLAHDERARANGDTRTIAEAAHQLECNTRSIRRLVELEWLRARPTPKAFRVTEESIAEFKKRYVSLLSIARMTNSASWALQRLCKRCNRAVAAIRSLLDKPQANADGSYDLYFGSNAPAGKENMWIKTIPGKGWWAAFRIYGPQAPAFDGMWKLNDIAR